MAKYSSGWHGQSQRHSNARKYGRAGGTYAGKDYWGRDTYIIKGKTYKEVDGVLHTVTKQGEPLAPYKNYKDKDFSVRGWNFEKSKPYIKSTNEGWFMRWTKGKDEIEIIRYYDDDKNKWQDFEVWHQINMGNESWDGEHLASFKTQAKAIEFAKEILNKRDIYLKR